ncbi:hypothetical protein HJFPF1_04805 [Paramyrothecium foliicola]|nr:hypothetical protein HJFPF1_04805 [Paramyrothecium foliicola]
MQKLFTVLSAWKPTNRLMLELNTFSPSDSEHWFKNYCIGLDAQNNRGSEHQEAPARWHDPKHGWVDGRQVESPPADAISRLFAPIYLRLSDSIPEVYAVTHLGAAAKLSRSRASSKSNDRHEIHEPTSFLQQRQQSTPIPPQIQPEPSERLSTPSSRHRALRRTPRFEATPSPEPRRIHIAAATLGFTPRALSFDQPLVNSVPPAGLEPALPIKSRQEPNPRRVLSQDLSEDFDEESSAHRSQKAQPSTFATDHPEPHQALRISKRTHSAILYALEEALRYPHPFTPDDDEELADMADLMSGGAPATSNGHGLASPRRPTAAPVPTGSPSGIRSPRVIMQERAAREARQRAEAEQQERLRMEAEQEARLREDARRRSSERRSGNAGVAANQGGGGTNIKQPPEAGRPPQDIHQGSRAQNTSQIPQPTASQQPPPPQTYATPIPTQQPSQPQQTVHAPRTDDVPPQAAGGSRPRNSFPHAFERWETLSAHWEGLTSYWIRKLEQNSNEVNRDPVSQQLARQVTDLSAAGANLFHAVVELQRLRASSERKFQRWFFETRAELERAQEVNARLEAALEKERSNRADAIQDAVERERGASKAQQQVAEMRRELAISKEEARRAWEELGRREQEERDRTFSLQSGQPTIVGGVQVVPMTQGLQSRQAGSSRDQSSYQSEYEQSYPPKQSSQPAQPSATVTDGGFYRPQEPSQQQMSSHEAAGSEGGYSEGEYVVDIRGNFILDAKGNRIPFAAPASTISGSDMDAEEYETPATGNPPSAGLAPPPPSSAPPSQWTGTYSNPQDYTGQGYGAPGWESVPRHHHPTRLSDVIEEEDERSRTSASQVSRG